MATAQEKTDIANLKTDVGSLKTDVAVMKNDISYIKASAEKMDKFIEENKPGIKTASLLNNQILTVVIAAIIGAGIIYLISKGVPQ